ncbi:MAG: hypothetical protein ACTHJH_00885 [Marmoricola sp.]
MSDQNPSEGGQVSTSSDLRSDSDDTPISPSDATEGYPVSESGYPDEPTEAGPNAITNKHRAEEPADPE